MVLLAPGLKPFEHVKAFTENPIHVSHLLSLKIENLKLFLTNIISLAYRKFKISSELNFFFQIALSLSSKSSRSFLTNYNIHSL